MLLRLGEVLHILSKNQLILRVGEPLLQPKNLEKFISTPVVDDNLQEHGTILEIFGPIDNPYVVVQLKTPPKDIEALLEQKFYYIGKDESRPK